MKKKVLGVSTLALIASSSLAWAQQTGPYYGHGMMWADGWCGRYFSPLAMVLFVAVAATVVVLIVRWLGTNERPVLATPSAHGQKDAIAILKDRFAHGEIEKEEFEEKRRVLEE